MKRSSTDGSHPEAKKSRINWKLLEHDRVRPLWHVAAMSLGVAPDLKAVALAQSDAKFVAEYAARKRMLARKMSVEPVVGHVTFFPDHPYNKSNKSTTNAMVDVVSCIDIFIAAGQKVPKPFIAMRPKLVAQGIPQHSRINVGLAAYHALATEVSKKKNAKDQSSRNSSVEIDNLNALVFAMAVGGYGYEPEGPVTEKQKIVKAILADVRSAGMSKYGLSTAASIQKKLIEAASRRSAEG